jgi:hypothetical protein
MFELVTAVLIIGCFCTELYIDWCHETFILHLFCVIGGQVLKLGCMKRYQCLYRWCSKPCWNGVQVNLLVVCSIPLCHEQLLVPVHSTLADMARQMLRDCTYDLQEIRQCRDCYRVSNEKTDKHWFCQPCRPPHQLVYAKQKGFPYWPAKVRLSFRTSENSTQVIVRWFTAHNIV